MFDDLHEAIASPVELENALEAIRIRRKDPNTPPGLVRELRHLLRKCREYRLIGILLSPEQSKTKRIYPKGFRRLCRKMFISKTHMNMLSSPIPTQTTSRPS